MKYFIPCLICCCGLQAFNNGLCLFVVAAYGWQDFQFWQGKIRLLLVPLRVWHVDFCPLPLCGDVFFLWTCIRLLSLEGFLFFFIWCALTFSVDGVDLFSCCCCCSVLFFVCFFNWPSRIMLWREDVWLWLIWINVPTLQVRMLFPPNCYLFIHV